MPKPPDSFSPVSPDDGRIGPEAPPTPRKTSPDRKALLPLVTTLRTAERVVIDAPLLEAFQAAASRHTLLALRSDLTAFDLWCRQHRRITLPAGAQDVADYLKFRAGQGAKPASLARYKASIARLHQLLGLVDATTAPLVKLTLAAIRRDKGVAQRQAAPLRFKGPVSDVERDPARGLNLRALLESCGADPMGLRDRALLSLAYDTGLLASELVAVTLEHIMPATDPDARLLKIARSKGDSEGGGLLRSLARGPRGRWKRGRKRPASLPARYSGE